MAVHEADPNKGNDLSYSGIHLELRTRVKPFVVSLEDVGRSSLVVGAMSVAASEAAPEDRQKYRLSVWEYDFDNHCFDYHSAEVSIP